MKGNVNTICMVVYNYFPAFVGGAERQCRLQAEELASRGYKCLILTARINNTSPKLEFDAGCEIVRFTIAQPLIDVLLRFKRIVFRQDSGNIKKENETFGTKAESKKIRASAWLVQWLNAMLFILGASIYIYIHRIQIDIIHTHGASWNAGFAGWIGNKLGIPVLCKAAYLPAFHNFRKAVPFSKTWRTWRRRIPFVALTREMADDIADNGVSRDTIYIIPNGVRIPTKVVAVDRNRYVLYVGNFTQGNEHKGFDVLVKAWAEVHKVKPEACLLIAGGGDSDPWQSMAKALNCEHSIRFLGHVPDMSMYYRQSSLFVLPSRGEGMSNALLEAQSYGIPAVVSDIPGNREIVVHKKTGLLVPVGNAEGFSEAILYLIQDDGVRRTMGLAARERIRDRFSIGSVVDELCSVYNSLSPQRFCDN